MSQGKELTTLGLQLPTDPRWANLTSYSIEEILTDHAYCEQKATSSFISLIQNYPDKIKLVQELAPVVTEEWGHFRLVIAELSKRNLKLGPQRKDDYVNELLKFTIKGGGREERLLDQLLLYALVEARSCERFKILSLHLEEAEIKEFYRHFMISEAGHYRMFLDLAEHYFDEVIVRKRWKEFLEYEADVMLKISPRGDRMH
ncbi:MAG: tRNA-(ms[2]io[6]A)-hydroxylase [Saprospiraceae bacterium]